MGLCQSLYTFFLLYALLLHNKNKFKSILKYIDDKPPANLINKTNFIRSYVGLWCKYNTRHQCEFYGCKLFINFRFTSGLATSDSISLLEMGEIVLKATGDSISALLGLATYLGSFPCTQQVKIWPLPWERARQKVILLNSVNCGTFRWGTILHAAVSLSYGRAGPKYKIKIAQRSSQ